MPHRTVLVPPERLERWFGNFSARHGTVRLAVDGGRLLAAAEDGEEARAGLPFERWYDGPPDVTRFAEAAGAVLPWGLLLVRKGGFAVALLRGGRMLVSKVGQRHVQGRTKAGGQSQQRFARRRENQAREAFEAAAEHAHRILLRESPDPLEALVCGGDRAAVDAVLADPRLAGLHGVRREPWLTVPDPRRAVLDRAAVDGRSATIRLSQASP